MSYGIYHAGRLYGHGASAQSCETWREAIRAARECVRCFGNAQLVRDEDDPARQWLVIPAGGAAIHVFRIVPAPPPPPAADPEPSAAAQTYHRAYVRALVDQGGVTTGQATQRRRAAHARRAARQAVIAGHGPEALDAQGRPR